MKALFYKIYGDMKKVDLANENRRAEWVGVAGLDAIPETQERPSFIYQDLKKRSWGGPPNPHLYSLISGWLISQYVMCMTVILKHN